MTSPPLSSKTEEYYYRKYTFHLTTDDDYGVEVDLAFPMEGPSSSSNGGSGGGSSSSSTNHATGNGRSTGGGGGGGSSSATPRKVCESSEGVYFFTPLGE